MQLAHPLLLVFGLWLLPAGEGGAVQLPPVAEAPVATSASQASEMAITRIELERRSVSELTQFLGSSDPVVKQRAVRAAGRLRQAEAIPVLTSLLSDGDASVRREVAAALALVPGSGPTLRQALDKEGDRDVQVQILLSLGMTGEAQDLELARQTLLTSQGPLASAAALAMGNMGYRKVAGLEKRENQAALLTALKRLDTETRVNAAFALARSGVTFQEPADKDALVYAASHDPSPVVRAFLVRAAASGVDDPHWNRLSHEVATDGAPGVRIAVLRGLARREKRADDILLPLLDDGERPVRLTALESLAQLEFGPGIQQRLRDLTRDPDLEIRGLAAVALHEHGLLDDARAWFAPDIPDQVRSRLAEAWDDQELLLDLAFQDPSARVRTAAVSNLLAQDPPISTAVLVRLLSHPDAVLAGGAATTLADRPDPSAEQALVQVLASARDWDLVVGVLQALEALYTSKAPRKPDPMLVSRLDELRASSDPVLRSRSRRLAALLGMPPARVEPPPSPFPDPADIRPLTSARVVTDRGEFVIAFDTENAPFTTWWWVHLAEQGFFDGLLFHRVVPDFVVQGGDPRGDGWGGPGTAIPDELNPIPFDALSVGMALSGPDTGGSQWFVTLSPQPHLTLRYTRFGEVIQGEDVIRRIRHGDRILRIIVERVS